jgi:GH24 family phage-related lysozyme (muramidase)
LRQDLHDALLGAQTYVDYFFGQGTWETLPQDHRDALTELVFNVGTLRKFPKFTRALVRGNLDKALAESTRYYRDTSGHLQPLARRNAAFINTFLKG